MNELLMNKLETSSSWDMILTWPIRFKAHNFKIDQKQNLFFWKLSPFWHIGVHNASTRKLRDQGIICQKKLAHLAYVGPLHED
jgi:hypothetical protein